MAQLVARFHGMEEATGSNPVSSTCKTPSQTGFQANLAKLIRSMCDQFRACDYHSCNRSRWLAARRTTAFMGPLSGTGWRRSGIRPGLEAAVWGPASQVEKD